MSEIANNAYNSDNLILGDELFVYVATDEQGTTYKPVAYTTTCSLNLGADSIDTSNKMAGVWSAALPGKLNWTVSTESLMSYDETGYGYFFDKLIARTPFLIKFGQVKNISTADFEMDAQKVYYSGQAYCTSCNLNADNGAVCTMSIEFTGDGPLTKTQGGVSGTSLDD